MIKGTIKIREKTFKDSSTMWNIDQYPKEGLYVIKDATETIPDQLICVGPVVAGTLPVVTYIGNWNVVDKFFGMEEEEEEEVKVPIVYEEMGAKGSISGDLLLDILSIAMHGTKAK